MRVAVIGAGVWGTSCAAFLSEKGARVTLFERMSPSSGATGFSAGVLTTQNWNPLDNQLVARTLYHVDKIEKTYAVRLFHRTGMIRMVPASSEQRIREMLGWQLAHDGATRFLRAQETCEMFPCLNTDGTELVTYSPGDGYLSPTDLNSLFVEHALNFGAKLVTSTRVTRVKPTRGDVMVEHSGGTARFDKAVVAAGAWTNKILGEFSVPAKPYRTQLAILKPRGFEIPVVDDQVNHFYFRPEPPNSLAAGDGTILREFDPDNYDAGGDEDFRREIAVKLSKRLRVSDNIAIAASWAGLVMGTPDRHPLLGALDEAERLYVGTGDNGFGVMRSAAVGEALAQTILGEKCAVDVSSYTVSRFSTYPAHFELKEGFSIE